MVDVRSGVCMAMLHRRDMCLIHENNTFFKTVTLVKILIPDGFRVFLAV